MRLTLEQNQKVQLAADVWAKERGFASAAQLPVQHALEMIDAVAARTAISAPLVRDALLAQAAEANARAEVGRSQLGTEGAYRGAREHAPLRTKDGQRPVATRMDLLAKRSVDDALGELDASFRQTVEDFEATRLAITDRAAPRTLDDLHRAGVKLLALFSQLEGKPEDAQLREEIIVAYKDLLSKGAKDRGIYLVKAPPGGFEELAVSAKDPKPEELRPADPLREPRYDALSDVVKADGSTSLDPERGRKLGRVPTVAVDAATGRKFVMDYFGEVDDVLSLEQFVSRRQTELEAQGKLQKRIGPKSIDQLRSVSEAALAKLGGAISWVSLLEDTAPDPLARVYPTRWYKPASDVFHRRVIVDGPFKGVALDDLAHYTTRTHAKGFAFDPKQGLFGHPAQPKGGEAWITTATLKERGEKRDKLYVQIPFEKEWTPVRQALRRLSELEPSIKYDKGSKNCGFYFEPGSYKAIRDVLRGLVLSEPALRSLESYFQELSAVELAASDASLKNHTAKAVGGFRASVMGPEGGERKIEFTYWQKKALAWLQARDYRGVISLDTGMGKTLTAIAAMQERLDRHDAKGRFLVVCPPALRGNFPKEIRKFMTEEAAEKLLARLDVLSYPEFSKARRTGQLGGKPFQAEKYDTVIFDEAQWMKSLTSQRAKTALSLDHPRKICLTASPMENSPMEAYVLACVANNINLVDRAEGKEHRWKMRKFKELYCETLGGRILGVKQKVELLPNVVIDPKHNLYTWVRGNIFHADKEIDEEKLPKFQLTSEVMTMQKEMEAEYKKKAYRILKVMRGMVSMYRDKGVVREYVDDKGRSRKEINPLARDKRIPQMFGIKFRGVIEAMNEVGNNSAKIERASAIVWKQLEANPKSRAVLFSDSGKYVLQSAREMSAQVPVKLHAACLGSEIRVYQNGKELTELAGHKLPFKSREYSDGQRTYKAEEWQQFVLNEVLGADAEVATVSLFAPVYQQGQNLQWANVGIHLDRDTWNRENTKQREARIWRKGQTQKVDFYNLDWIYKKPADDFDRTLDEIRGFHEAVGETLFHEIIEVPQTTVKLGEEWSAVRDVDDLVLTFDQLELGLLATADQAGRTGVH